MRAASLKPGDRVRINRNGLNFEATVERLTPDVRGGETMVKFSNPKPVIGWKFLPVRMVKEKL